MAGEGAWLIQVADYWELVVMNSENECEMQSQVDGSYLGCRLSDHSAASQSSLKRALPW